MFIQAKLPNLLWSREPEGKCFIIRFNKIVGTRTFWMTKCRQCLHRLSRSELQAPHTTQQRSWKLRVAYAWTFSGSTSIDSDCWNRSEECSGLAKDAGLEGEHNLFFFFFFLFRHTLTSTFTVCWTGPSRSASGITPPLETCFRAVNEVKSLLCYRSIQRLN